MNGFLALLMYIAFALSRKLSLCQPVSSCTFPFLILFPIPLGQSKGLHGAELPVGLNPIKIPTTCSQKVMLDKPNKACGMSPSAEDKSQRPLCPLRAALHISMRIPPTS